MTEDSKYNIVLIEPSIIVQQGIKTFLKNSEKFYITHVFQDFHTYENTPIGLRYQIVILNPSLVNVYKQYSSKSLFAKHPGIIVIGLVYNYSDIETLESFDGLLNIYMTEAQFLKKLVKIVEDQDMHLNKVGYDSVELSEREQEILISVAVGLTNKEIADKHNISVHTVMSHRKNISRKIGIKTVSGLTIYAIFNKLITEDDIK